MASSTILTCECGSTFFFTARAEQFQSGGYGSAEFRSLSNAPKTILVCLCGKPVTPKPAYYAKGTLAQLAEDAFKTSTEAAQKVHNEASMQHIAQIAASPAEVQELKDQIEELRKALLALSEPKAPQPKETHSRKKKSEVPKG